MKKSVLTILFSILSIMASAQTKIYLSTSGKTISATLENNDATSRLVSQLSGAPIVVEMEEYGGFEMVGALPQSLPSADSQITTVAGDIMLYLGRNIVIFFGSNTWSYTPLGKIDDATSDKVREFFGSDNAVLTISLQPLSTLQEISMDGDEIPEVYDLNGHRVDNRNIKTGVYIVDGKKVILRK